jgi:hypothetical protein
MAADASTGAILEHVPNLVHADMTPIQRVKNKTPGLRRRQLTPVGSLSVPLGAS